MSATLPETRPRSRLIPDTSRGFWRICLLASLLVNLGMAGLVIGYMTWQHKHRFSPISYRLFMPRQFFEGLPAERRRELDGLLRKSKLEFEALRRKNAEIAGQVADELEKPAYDPARVAALIDAMSSGPQSLAVRGALVLEDFYTKLTPEERVNLARAIRNKQSRPDMK